MPDEIVAVNVIDLRQYTKEKDGYHCNNHCPHKA
jgi:hypothetical protein